MAHNGRHHAFRANLETAGNLLNGFSHLLGEDKNERGQYTLFNIAYAQYVKGDFDYTHLIRFDRRNQLAIHAGFGIAYPYGNSRILPFEKRYFSGGANSVRGWSVRGLGPGKFKGSNGAIDFINQTKLENVPVEETIKPQLSEEDQRSQKTRRMLKYFITAIGVVCLALFGYVVYTLYMLLG